VQLLYHTPFKAQALFIENRTRPQGQNTRLKPGICLDLDQTV